ncbi:MAG: hypothetical protein ACTHME_02410 [Candidatus Nitrosocosmicus sp.]
MNKNKIADFLIFFSINILLIFSVFSLANKNYFLDFVNAQNPSVFNKSNLSDKSLSVTVSKKPNIVAGANQTIGFMVIDKTNGLPVNAAHISGVTIYVNPHQVPFDIFTNNTGKAHFSWKIPEFAAPGEYTIKAIIEAPGYAPVNIQTEFHVQ